MVCSYLLAIEEQLIFKINAFQKKAKLSKKMFALNCSFMFSHWMKIFNIFGLLQLKIRIFPFFVKN